ncbi:hypothetical protein [Lyngbya confervoides]|uniref:Uncharacterized protein n=1 Tax=Lyngbya confervoides BDU141951 TaxID=1574623 RepID=A0ABD4T326_9CYAN|nr:hypothetical protein [Lyngbya confervoides]MCM1982924.1 hypothetical protein [Lyngbya confervoides BDU141951]
MWQLTSPTTQRGVLNFSASGQSPMTVNQLYDGRTQLINAVECVNWGEATLQFIVCEACGYPGCQSQGWVALRRAGSLAFIMPAFQAMEDDHQEYGPPPYLLEQGVLFLEQEIYTQTLCNLIACPDFDSIAPLSRWEAAKIFQFEAPGRILGDLLTSPHLPQDRVLASSAGNFMEQTVGLNTLLSELLSQNHPVELHKLMALDQVVEFYLDLAGISAWKALRDDGRYYSLYLEPGYVIETPSMRHCPG